MTLVILCRQIDISIGSHFSICGVVAGLLARAGPADAAGRRWGRSWPGRRWGRSTALLVAGLGLPSIVVTLATLVIRRESLRYLREGRVRPRPAAGLPVVRRRARRPGQWLVVAIALVVFAAFAWGLRHLAAGRAGLRDRLGPRGRAAGGHPAAARRLRRLRRRWGPWRAWPPCSTPSASPTSIPNAGAGLELQVDRRRGRRRRGGLGRARDARRHA